MADTSLNTLAQAVLTEVVQTYTAAAVTLPTRRYVSIGPPVFDCEQAVVSFDRFYTGFPSLESLAPEIPGCGEPRSMDLSIWIIRCVPKSGDEGVPTPTVAKLNTSSLEILTDVATLFYGLRVSWSANTFLSRCQTSSWGPVEPIEPSGGYGGIRMSIGIEAE